MKILIIFLFNFFQVLQTQAVLRSRPFVVLDPGHGGEDAGAIRFLDGVRIDEKNITLTIAKEISKALSRKKILNVLTRTEDNVVLLDRRTAIAKNFSKKKNLNPLFVSVHVNTNRDPSISGIETYVFNATTNDASKRLAEIENGSHRVSQKGMLSLILSDLSATANYSESVALACSVQKDLFLGLKKTYPMKAHFTRDRGVKNGLFYVLMDSGIPSILVELGFSSNSQELRSLTDPTYQSLIAESIASGIEDWNPQYKWKRNRDPLRMSAIQKKPSEVACP